MTSNFTKLSIVTAIFLGLASYSVLKNKDSNLFSERGNTFIENLPSKLNDIQKIKITGRDLDMELINKNNSFICLLYTSPSPRDSRVSRMPSSA